MDRRFIEFQMSRWILQILVICLPVVLFGWLLWVDIAPSGVRTAKYVPFEINPYVHRPLPDERAVEVDATEEAYLSLTGNPVYMSVDLPRTGFDQVEVAVEFQNDGQPLFEIGGLVDVFSESYDLKALHNPILEDSSWHRSASEDGTFLLERSREYGSVDAFLRTPPDRSATAVYRYDIDSPFRMGAGENLYESRDWNVSLRGSHAVATYLGGEGLDLTLTFMDMNRTYGNDEVRVVLRNEQGNVVKEVKSQDDGNDTSNQISSTRTLSLKTNSLPEGVYTLELLGTSDIFWRRIQTNTRFFVFRNRLYIGDTVGHLQESVPTHFYTDGKRLSFETFHADSADRIMIGQKTIPIHTNHELVSAFIDERGVLGASVLRGDIRITGTALFAFDQDAFFQPFATPVDAYTNLDALKEDYVLATYSVPLTEGDWRKATATFDIPELYQHDRSLKFVFSIPRREDVDAEIRIRSVEVRFKKEPVTSVSGFLREVFERIPFL